LYIEGRRQPVPVPPTDDPLQLFLADGEIIVERRSSTSEAEAQIRVTRLTHSGDTVYSVLHPYTPVRYTDAALDAVATSSARVPGGSFAIVNGMPQITPYADSIAAADMIRERLEFPEFQMPVRGSFIADDGSFWLLREDDGSGTAHWVLFAPNGRSRGRLDLPMNFRPVWASGDQVFINEPDENDVPFLVRYRIVESPKRR
jgi:hypothetical protein